MKKVRMMLLSLLAIILVMTVGPNKVNAASDDYGLSTLLIGQTVDKEGAEPGDILTYTVKVTNTGLKASSKFNLSEAVNTSFTEYQAGSLTMDGKSYTDVTDGDAGSVENGNIFAVLPRLSVGKSSTVVFKVRVKDTVVDGTVISNQATITDVATGLNSKKSNTVTTTIKSSEWDGIATMEGETSQTGISLVKTVDKVNAMPGEILTYSIRVKNNTLLRTGSYNIQDNFNNNNLDYVTGSIAVNGISLSDAGTTGAYYSFYAPSSNGVGGIISVTNPDLLAGQESVITFKARVRQNTPIGTTINNVAKFKYATNSTPAQYTNQASTLVTNAPIYNAVSLTKAVDKSAAKPGDILTYSIKVKNNNAIRTGQFELRDNFNDNNLDYVTGSMSMDGVPLSDTGGTIGSYRSYYSPGSTGVGGLISVVGSDLLPGQEITFTFKAKVRANTQTGTIINNTGRFYFAGTLDPTQHSNQVATVIENTPAPVYSAVDFLKTVDKSVAVPGDILTYTIKVKNNNSVAIGDLKVRDDFRGQNIDYVDGSLTLNGQAETGLYIPGDSGLGGFLSLSTPVLPAGQEMTVTFKVKVKENTTDGTIISNTATLIDSGTGMGSKQSNQVSSVVKASEKPTMNAVSTVKSVDKTEAQAGDILTYTIKVKNNNATTVGGFTVTDDLDLTKVDYQAGSITVDGISYTDAQDGDRGSYVRGKVTAGIKNALAPNEEAVITFKVKAKANLANGTTIPNKANVLERNGIGEKQTNQVVTTVATKASLDLIDAVKSVDKTEAKPGDTLTYTIKAKNNNTSPVGSIRIKDILDPALVAYQKNSLTLNGKNLTDASDSDEGQEVNNGITVEMKDKLAAGQEMVVTFKVTVRESLTSNVVISNQGTVFDIGTELGSKSTNIVNVNVQMSAAVKPTLDLIEVSKNVDKSIATSGNVLNYTIKVKNNNPVPAGGFTVTDTMDVTRIEYQKGSLKINGISVSDEVDNDRGSYFDSLISADLDVLQPGQEVTITFAATILYGLSANEVIANKASVVDKTGLGKKETNMVETVISLPANASSIEAIKEVNTGKAKIGDSLTYTIRIKNNAAIPVNNFKVFDRLDLATMDYEVQSITIDGIFYTDAEDGDAVSYKNSNGEVLVNYATLAPGATSVVTFKIKVKQEAAGKTITNRAYIADQNELNQKRTNVVGTSIEALPSVEVPVKVNHWVDYNDGSGYKLYRENNFNLGTGLEFIIDNYRLTDGLAAYFTFDYSNPADDFIITDTGKEIVIDYYYHAN